MQLRYGVFAAAGGWVVAGADQMECFAELGEALKAARQRAGLARWRGDEVEILAQAAPGAPLAPVPPVSNP
jgi:hypothetical protein